MTNRQRMIAETIAYLVSEHRRIADALVAIGHPGAFEVQPMNIEQQVIAAIDGADSISFGTTSDPYVVVSESNEQIGAYYIEVDDERCWIRWVSGRQDFMSALHQTRSIH